MKKIIKTKLYDTETAKKLGEFSAPCGRNDIHFYEETIYLKRTGEFFLYGSGNAGSKYNKSCGQQWCGNEAIIPLTYEEAREWAEKHLDAGEYSTIFGEPAENAEKERLNVWISAQSMKKLRDIQAETGLTIGEIVEGIIGTIK